MINAYVDSEVMGLLAELDSDTEVSKKRDVVIEFIDAAPLTAQITYSGNATEISIYARDEMHTDSNLALHGTVKEGVVTVDSGDEETVNIAYAVAEAINKVIVEKKLEAECDNLDEELDGLLFSNKDDNVLVKVVSGKKRPALLCTTMFGAPRMMRPYSDEIMAQFAMDSMSPEEMEEAANAGDPDAMEQLAMAYLNGDDDIEENPEKAYYWFVKSAEAGNDQAMFNVGLFTAKGFGTNRDFGKAAEWMIKAAEAGDDDAANCAEEYKKMAENLVKAEAGDATAQGELAVGFMKLGGSLDQAGEGKDYEESVMWAEKAAQQGNGKGFCTLALAYQHGRGVKTDIKKAIEYYKKGADAGDALSQFNLGCEYMTGMNLKKDAKRGFELIKSAAEQGYGLAMKELGRCYQFATGTTGNMKKAVEWYEKALEVIDDPELEQKTMMFKMMADADPEFGEDYPEDEGEDVDTSNLPDGYMEALEAAIEAEGANKTESTTEDEANDDASVVEELSAEEMREKIQSGEGVIKQIVKNADGTEKEVAIWGGYELDGFDRTLNVFMNQADISRFVKMVSEEEINAEGIDDPCENEIGYQITVDFMDMAATSILRRGLGKLSMEMYVRDERKTCSRTVDVGCGTIDLEEDGSISISQELLTQNRFLVYGIAYIGLRKYLMTKGIVQELYRMYDESAGVLVKVGKSGTITTKIVKGMERPDLPCEIFLLGTQDCRPYVDEMLGLKSSGIRKPFDPAIAEKMKAAEKERLKQKAEAEEKAKKKAEEERIAKEKAEAEEKARKEKAKAEEKARKEREAAERKAKEEARKAEEKRLAEEKAKAEKEAFERIKGKIPEKRDYYDYAFGLMGAAYKAFACVRPDGNVNSYCSYMVIGKGTPGDTSRFKNIKKIVCTSDGVVGLRYDGTCISTVPGFTYAYINECNSWRNIVDISAGDHQVIGLKADGTCVANSIKWNTGYGYDGQSDVGGWSNIAKVVCAHNHTIGLKKDGSVILACTSDYCKVKGVARWTNVDLIDTDANGAVALTYDGKFLSCGSAITDGLSPEKGILQLTVCCGVVYALYMDGTVGRGKSDKVRGYNVSEKNVIALKAEGRTLYVLTKDGRVHLYGSDSFNKVPSEIKLFDDYDKIFEDRRKEEQRKKEEEELKAKRREQGVCQHCGGSFKKGFFSTKCTSCGKSKDY